MGLDGTQRLCSSPVAIALATVSLNVLFVGDKFSAERIGPETGQLVTASFCFFQSHLIDAPLGEESGWRGYALPRFPASRSPLENTLILGMLVAGWHLPIALSEGSILAPYLIATVASAVVTNWVYYNANESALLAILYHTAANTMGLYLFQASSGPELTRLFWLLAAVNCLVAAAVVLVVPGRVSWFNHRSTICQP